MRGAGRGRATTKLSVLVFAASSLSACALRTPRPDNGDPDYRARRAFDALHLDAFPVARNDLQWLASRCDAGERGRRALLLLAAAELDPQNRHGSPHRAARAAANYLLLPDAEGEHVPLARALYRLAIDRGATPADTEAFVGEDGPQFAGRFDTCDAEGPIDPTLSLPTTPVETNAERMRALEAKVLALRTESDSLRIRADELEAELERISELLREGGRAPVSAVRR
jgi:hypothetical protein